MEGNEPEERPDDRVEDLLDDDRYEAPTGAWQVFRLPPDQTLMLPRRRWTRWLLPSALALAIAASPLALIGILRSSRSSRPTVELIPMSQNRPAHPTQSAETGPGPTTTLLS
jgi:hypothetical protein